MTLSLFLFFIGFYVLVKGANWLVDGASSLARRLNIPGIIIGLVIAGIGTSIPEFAVTFFSNLTGEGGIGLGTVVGSNTFNILFILGFTALAFRLPFRTEWVERDLWWNMLAVAIVLVFALPGANGISRLEGVFMLLIFGAWIYVVIRQSNQMEETAEPEIRLLTFPIALGFILAGLVGVVIGGKWVVDGAVVFARALGTSEQLIGLTIVGIGTSLPELAVTFVAAYKGRMGIAIGNIIGSNIFDFLMILGFAALFKPISFPQDAFFDGIVTLFSAALLYGSMFVGEPLVLKRWQGLVFVFLYVVYLVYILGRG
ncbi:MAG: calcium/sodium antiporter [Candidatus Sungbacteria bacterium]|nr:calcium/sodium antiporter [Candidatus Sungbacteria bacterium]